MNSNFHFQLLHNFFQKPSFKNHLSFLSFFNYNFHHLRNYKILILLWWINTEFPKILSEPREVDREGGRRSWEISKQNWGGENEKEESEYKPRRGGGEGGGCGRGTYGVNALTSKWLAGTIIAHSRLRPHTHSRGERVCCAPGGGVRDYPDRNAVYYILPRLTGRTLIWKSR